MSAEHDDDTSLTIFDLFANLVADDDAAAIREVFCEVVATQLKEVASWLAFDAFIGAGDQKDQDSVDKVEVDPIRHRSFIAVGLVAQISSELVGGALVLFREGNQYSASALIRQLIECEYLLRVFRLNFSESARWHDASDRERWDFAPSKLRNIIGFDREEYANHCDTGGHPNPKARNLLELPRKMEALARTRLEKKSAELDVVRVLWLDFALHCDRIWRVLSDLLSAEHARFQTAGRTLKSANAVARSRAAWHEADPLAQNFGPLMALVNADPEKPLIELLDEDSNSA